MSRNSHLQGDPVSIGRREAITTALLNSKS
jgi:hypothetical protein